MIRVHATLKNTNDEVRASCTEIDASGTGPTRSAAIEALREAIQLRMKPEAVALPSSTEESAIEIVVGELDGEERAGPEEPTGPGDAAFAPALTPQMHKDGAPTGGASTADARASKAARRERDRE